LAIAELGRQPFQAADPQPQPRKIRLGVARDRAFCFYYQDNLDILSAAGAEICPFSPLADERLPEDIDGLYLGGGYPELYAQRLSSNRGMLAAIRSWAESNRPIYAECGGFMYLTEGINTLDKQFFPMAAVFPVKTSMQDKRAGLGYRQLSTLVPSCFGPKGTVLRGHEFHYSRIEAMAGDIEQIYAVNNGTTEGYRYKNVIGGYMHLHFGFNPQAAGNFVQFCKDT
jgi:cobyrinic acid a,c-diamide synthase